MRFRSSLCFIVLAFLSACSRTPNDPYGYDNSSNPYPLGNGPRVTFDSSVSQDQAQLLQDDLNYLATFRFNSYSQDDLSKLGVSDLNTPTLLKFISDRIKYIVGESFDLKYNSSTTTLNGGYQPSLFTEFGEDFSRVVTVMVNTGSAAYLDGKGKQKVYTVFINGSSVRVDSPRVGLIQIGEGLFSANRVKTSELNAKVNRLMRLGTLFHESRHDDGNGSNAGFPHKLCDSGDFKGYYACENNLNGPYNIEAILLKRFYEACTGCTETELSALQASAADSASRLSANPQMPDPTPERIQ